MSRPSKFDPLFTVMIGFLLVFSVFMFKSVNPTLFPAYFGYLFLALAAFWLFTSLDFEILALFAKPLYLGSLFFLILTLFLGQVTRGVVRWIPVGALTVQAAEIVRPFLLVAAAVFLTRERLNGRKLIQTVVILFAPVVLILLQPSLGVGALLACGLIGVYLASGIKRSYLVYLIGGAVILLPLFWLVLAPYQKARLMGFLNPEEDPLGRGYNRIQAMISVGSGGLFGRGLGKGVQTQLSFLPEKSNDFIFAAVSEELGFIGSSALLVLFFLIFGRLASFLSTSASPAARAYLAGFFIMFLAQVVIHVGMNMGILPITGIPLPLVSGGGSSLLATLIGLGIAQGARKR
jgi:rod shape determining protein RodA